MDLHKIGIKVFHSAGADVAPERYADVFHGWIQRQAFADHLMIDAADYKHVHHGPGMMLICHEANLAIDEHDGKRGLAYQRKTALAGSLPERIRLALKYALTAAQLLETEPDLGQKFDVGELLVRAYDRLLAPNTAEGWSAFEPAVAEAVSGLGAAKVEKVGADEEVLTAQVSLDGEGDVAGLLAKF